jgi:peptidoglycan/LPS O-acetylase OafA/YrhL
MQGEQLFKFHSTIETAFNPKKNSLNFLRLALALCVVIAHSYYGGISISTTTLGSIAVYGFFGISGFLIAGSADHNGTLRYLWQRFLRIFPAYWVCLVLTAFFFALLAWVTTSHHSVGAFLKAPAGPIGYDISNSLLLTRQLTIAGTIWNSSIWTLFYEFLCYLLVGAMAFVGILQRRWLTALTAIGMWGVMAMFTATDLRNHFGDSRYWILMNFIKFASVFLVGTFIYAYRSVIPDSRLLALACSAVFVVTLWLPSTAHTVAFDFSYPALFSPFIVYPVLWLGIHLPFHRVGAKNDYSYGVYIYAFPVTVLLGYWHGYRWGYLPYLLGVIIFTIPFAVASWWLIEKRAMSYRQQDFRPFWDWLTLPKAKAKAE